MTLRGIIQDGRIVVEEGSLPPEGTHVTIRASKARKPARSGRDPLATLRRWAIRTGISDLADQHDHYIYGTPKRPVKKAKARTKKRRSGR